jgi:hypothetical protein
MKRGDIYTSLIHTYMLVVLLMSNMTLPINLVVSGNMSQTATEERYTISLFLQ